MLIDIDMDISVGGIVAVGDGVGEADGEADGDSVGGSVGVSAIGQRSGIGVPRSN